MFDNRNFFKKTAGFSLVEMMIAMTLSGLMISCLVSFFLVLQKNYQTLMALNNIQENARIATHVLSSEIHLAGYIGCAKLTDDFPLKNNAAIEFNAKNKIKVDRDSLTVSHADIYHATLVQLSNENLFMTAPPYFQVNDVLIISDCKSAEIFKVKKITLISDALQKIIPDQPLTRRYDAFSELSRLQENTYFVEKNTLFVKNRSQRKEKLIVGVNDMKVTQEKNGISIRLLLSAEKFPLQKVQYIYAAIG